MFCVCGFLCPVLQTRTSAALEQYWNFVWSGSGLQCRALTVVRVGWWCSCIALLPSLHPAQQQSHCQLRVMPSWRGLPALPVSSTIVNYLESSAPSYSTSNMSGALSMYAWRALTRGLLMYLGGCMCPMCPIACILVHRPGLALYEPYVR